MKVNAIQCNKCKSVIFSRTTRDFRFCLCGEVAISGGRDYTEVSSDVNGCIPLELDLPTCQAELKYDYDLGRQYWGIYTKEQYYKKLLADGKINNIEYALSIL